MKVSCGFKSAAKGYLLRDERGSATIETVLWLPIFILFFALIVDASMVFNAQANLTRIVQDANRLCAVRQFTTAAQVQNYIASRLDKSVLDDTTDTRIQSDCGSHPLVSTQVIVAAGHYMAVGPFPALDNIKLVVHAQMMRET